MAKILTPEIAETYLHSRGIRLGEWGSLESRQSQKRWVKSSFCTGKNVYELLNFSQHVAGWITQGNWKILQIGNSSYFSPDQAIVLAALICGPTARVDFTKHQTFLFEFDADEESRLQTEVMLAFLIHLMLVYEAHCYLVSSGGAVGEILAIQDGVVYFYADDDRLMSATNLLQSFEANPNQTAPWIPQP